MDILKKRWTEIDKKLTSFYNKNKKLNKDMFNNIQQILESINVKYDNLFDYVDKKYQRILRSKINELKKDGEIEGYVGYLLNQYINKKKLRYSEYLTGLFLIEYYKRDLERDKIEYELFKEVSIIAYKDAQIETAEVLEKKKPRLLTVPEAFLLQLIAMAMYNNAFWKDYKQGSISYNAEQLFKTVANDLQTTGELSVESKVYKMLFDKQERNYLAKKKLIPNIDIYEDEYYGPLDDIMTYIANQMVLKGAIAQGCKKVMFIATIDDKTTDMCRSLNNQIFSVNGINKYKRYSAIDDEIVEYTTKGLKTGENLPPINNHIHHCRSTIIPIKDIV